MCHGLKKVGKHWFNVNPTLQAAERRSATVWSLLTGTWTVRPSGMWTQLVQSQALPSGGNRE